MSEELERMAREIQEFEKHMKQKEMNLFFQDIKHGDETHVEWLAKKFEEFFKIDIAR